MKSIDIKSLCIGFLSATLIFTLMGAKQKKNLGDLNSELSLAESELEVISSISKDINVSTLVILSNISLGIASKVSQFFSISSIPA